jgi:hypothetical protein
MTEAASPSEMSVNFYQTTWRNIPEDSHLHTRRCENNLFPSLSFFLLAQTLEHNTLLDDRFVTFASFIGILFLL